MPRDRDAISKYRRTSYVVTRTSRRPMLAGSHGFLDLEDSEVRDGAGDIDGDIDGPTQPLREASASVAALVPLATAPTLPIPVLPDWCRRFE